MKKLVLASIALTGALPGCAMAADLRQLPGGPADPAYPAYTIYAGKPASGVVPKTRTCRQAAKYIEYVATGKAREVAALFDDDAFFYEPARNTLAQGRQQIDAFFRGTIGPMSPNVIGVAYIGSGAECVVEIAIETRWNGKTQFTMVSLDHFTLGKNGRFSRMIAFVRAMPPGMVPASIPLEMIPTLKNVTPAE